MSSSSNRRRDLSPPRGGVGSSKLRMDRQPVVARITGTVCGVVGLGSVLPPSPANDGVFCFLFFVFFLFSLLD